MRTLRPLYDVGSIIKEKLYNIMSELRTVSEEFLSINNLKLSISLALDCAVGEFGAELGK